MVGLVGLQKAAADAGVAAGAADHLMQKLEGALGGARIAVAQAEIRIDHADQIEHREMMALGDQLGADDDVEQAFGDVGEFLAHALDGGDEIARQHQHARAAETARALLLRAARRPGRRRRRNFPRWHFGHAAGCGMAKPQWWQTSCLRKR